MIERIVRILAAFDREQTDLTPSEVARRSGLPVSSTHRIVGDLTRAGILERDPDGNVRIGMRLWELTTRGSRALALRQAAMPAMERVQAVVGEHTQLGVVDRDEVLFIERLSDPGAVSNKAAIAGRLPLHASSSGLVLLAFGRQQLRERILNGSLPAVGPATITDRAQLRRRLEAIRRDGYAILPASIESVATGIAVPVVDRTGTTVAALSVVIPHGSPNAERALAALLEGSTAIGRAIQGYDILSH